MSESYYSVNFSEVSDPINHEEEEEKKVSESEQDDTSAFEPREGDIDPMSETVSNTTGAAAKHEVESEAISDETRSYKRHWRAQ